MKKAIAFLFAACLGAGCGLALALAFQVATVDDNSMLPSYEEGQRILVSNFAYEKEGAPRRGDVVLMKNFMYASTGENGIMMKRVIGISGDRIMINAGKVYVNNRQLEEDYVFTPGTSGEMEEVTVPAGKVFVLGDNRAASTDSRSETVGMADLDALFGKVIFKW